MSAVDTASSYSQAIRLAYSVFARVSTVLRKLASAGCAAGAEGSAVSVSCWVQLPRPLRSLISGAPPISEAPLMSGAPPIDRALPASDVSPVPRAPFVPAWAIPAVFAAETSDWLPPSSTIT